MILALVPPSFQQLGELVTIEEVYVQEGERVGVGTKLFDCMVDLSGTNPHDCPPRTLYRVTARENGFVRSLALAAGHVVNGAAPLALLSTDAEESLAPPPARQVRLAVAAILPATLW